MLEKVTISGYRGARDVALVPGSACVLVGESSSGKSTVLSAIWMLLEAAAPMPTGEDVSRGTPASTSRRSWATAHCFSTRGRRRRST